MIERHDSVDESGVGIGRVKRGEKSKDTSRLVSNPSGRGLRRQPYNLTNSTWPSEQAIDLNLQQQYVYGFEHVDEPVAQYEANGTVYLVRQDANYNVVALVDTRGDVTEQYTYAPYGALLADGHPWSLIVTVLYCSTRTIARWKER